MSVKDNEYSVNWKSHSKHVLHAFSSLLESNELTDVTIYCENKTIEAHKVLLSACSTYFRETFKSVPCRHPVIVLYGVEFSVLSDILQFIYNGEVNIDNSKLDMFLKTAQLLKINGLTESQSDAVDTKNESIDIQENPFQFDSENNTLLPTTVNEKVDDFESVLKGSNQDVGPVQNKIIKIGTNTSSLFASDVKTEPEEVENLDDPLNEDLQLMEAETANLFGYNDGNQNILEKIYSIKTSLRRSPMNSEGKLSTYSEDCLKCSICNKVFSHPYSLHHHKAVHSGNTECPICHAVLSRKYNLKMHMRSRHNL